MHIGVITLFPDMVHSALQYGIVGRALRQAALTVSTWNPRDYTTDPHHTVDDRPYGGGPGMVMKMQPLQQAIGQARSHLNSPDNPAWVVYLTPQGQRLDQKGVQSLALHPNLILLAGRYEGIDERIVQTEVDAEWSIGDYVLSGGELAALVMIDAISRLLPGVLGHPASAQQDSYMQGLLDYPHYTRPEASGHLTVPSILLSGNHTAIARWRQQQALGRTWLRRPDLLQNTPLNPEQQQLLAEFIHDYNHKGIQ